MADNVSVSGTTDPYTQQYYSAGSTEKNTLTVTSFIKQVVSKQLTGGIFHEKEISAGHGFAGHGTGL